MRMLSLKQLLEQDLDYICGNLTGEFNAMSGKKLLVTGGAGFLGYYLVQSILHWNDSHAAGEEIKLTVFDNYIRGVPAWLRSLDGHTGLTLKRQDMRDALPEDMEDFQFIIHAAGIASPIYYRMHPIETIDANINGLRNLLDYALGRKNGGSPVDGFLFFSSSEIYGDPPPEEIPTREDYRGFVSCTGPRACYDESKRFGETLCVNFARQYGLPVVVARPFNNYGPGLKITDRRVMPDFANDVLNDRDIVMLSDGSPRRTFCYSADAVCGYYKALIKGRPGEAYNIGVEGPEISVGELAEKLVQCARELFGYKGKVVRMKSDETDYLVDNPNRRCPDISKARNEIGYDPSTSIDEGIYRSLVWYHFNRDAEDA